MSHIGSKYLGDLSIKKHPFSSLTDGIKLLLAGSSLFSKFSNILDSIESSFRNVVRVVLINKVMNELKGEIYVVQNC